MAAKEDGQRSVLDLPVTGSETPSMRESDPEKNPQPTKPHAPAAPDGGFAAWSVVLGAWCAGFCSFGWLNSIGTFQEYYQNVLLSDHSPSTISWIPSLQIFFMMAMGPIVGTIYDRYGPRWLLLGGSFLHVFGIMMASLGTEYYQILLAQGVCSGIGVSAIFQPSITVLHGWFSKKRGAAFGIAVAGSSIGGVIFPIMTSRLVRQVGFGWTMRIGAFIILFLLAIANLTVRANHPPYPQKVTKEQLLRPFTEIEFVFVLLGFLCFTYGIFVPINYLPAQALDAGMRADLVEYLIPILNAASLFGRITSGVLGDKIGKYNIFIVVCYLSGIWVLALWIPATNLAAFISFAALFGFTSGAYVSLIAPLVMQISPAAEIGFRTGLLFLNNSIGGLTTNPISGAILDSSSGWVGVKVFAGVFCLVGTTFILAARVYRVGWKPTVVF